MILDISFQSTKDPTIQTLPVKCYTGSALPLSIMGAPESIGAERVETFEIVLVNPDGAEIVAAATRCGKYWTAVFAASAFASYGTVLRGVKFRAVSATHSAIVAAADLDVRRGSSDAQPGDPAKHYQMLGADQYFKSEVIDGVQHYKRVGIEYDARIGWGLSEPSGDYIVNADGEMVPAN